jgi:hypothetical protein
MPVLSSSPSPAKAPCGMTWPGAQPFACRPPPVPVPAVEPVEPDEAADEPEEPVPVVVEPAEELPLPVVPPLADFEVPDVLVARLMQG